MASRSGSLDFHSEDTAGRCCIQRNTACQSARLLLASHSAYSSVEPAKHKETNKKNPFEMTKFTSVRCLRKRKHSTQPPALPGRREASQETSSNGIRWWGHSSPRLATHRHTPCFSHETPPPNSGHQVSQCQYSPQRHWAGGAGWASGCVVLGCWLGLNLWLTGGREFQSLYTHDCFASVNLWTNSSIPSTRTAISINH